MPNNLSHFDADLFMNQTYAEANATRFTPVPEGEYLARVGAGPDDVKVDVVTAKDGIRTFLRLTMWWEVLDEALKARLERDSIRVRDQFLLDVAEDGSLQFGENLNVRLGNRREALGLNDPGRQFSLGHLRGAGPALIRVTQTSNPNDPERKYSEVSRAVAA